MRALVVALLIAACDRGVPAPTPIVPPTQAQAEAFAKSFGQAMTTCSPTIDQMVDFDELAKRALTHTKLDTEMARGFMKGLKSTPIHQMLCQSFPKGTSYTLLRVRDGKPLFRMVAGGAQGFNYQELELTVSPDKQVRAVDLYSYTTGEPLSTTVGELGASIAGVEIDSTANKLTQVKTQIASGDYAGARQTIQSLPAEVRATKGMRIALVQAAMNLDDKTYAQEIESYRASFPTDPSIDLVAIDGAYLKNDYAGALKIIERLDKRVGGDPYLDVLRANAHALAGETAKAIADARSATTREPTLREGWLALAQVSARAEDIPAGIAALHKLEALGVKIDDELLKQNPVLEPVVTSPDWHAAK